MNVTRALPVRAYGLLATDIPDIQLKAFVVQRFDVKALHHHMVVEQRVCQGDITRCSHNILAVKAQQEQALPVLV